MAKLYLQLGFPKTATSYLQKCFYPHLIKTHFIDRLKYRNIATKIREEHLSPKEIKNFNDYFSSLMKERTLISYENFSGGTFCNFPKGRKNILIDLKKIFSEHEISIILVLREQTDLLASLYKGYILNGGTKTCKELLKDIDKEYLYFSDYLDKVIDIFDENKLYIECFENFKNDKIKFLRELIKFIGEEEMPNFEDKYVNRGYGELQLKLGRLINSLFQTDHNPDGYISHERFNKYFSVNFPQKLLRNRISYGLHYKKFKLPDDEKNRLKEDYIKDNKRLKRKYNLDLPECYLSK